LSCLRIKFHIPDFSGSLTVYILHRSVQRHCTHSIFSSPWKLNL
jgi:hypothetical protein